MRLTDGYTLMHEHVTIDLSGVKGDEDCRLDCLDETIEEFRRLYAFGVRNILDVTNLGMGRNVEYVRKVSEKTGIDQVMYSVAIQPLYEELTKNGETQEEAAERLYQSLAAMDGMVHLFYQHKGLSDNPVAGDTTYEKDRLPVSRLNIRYQRMFDGAFMYAGGLHIGIEWDSVGLVGGSVPVEADADGKYQSGRYFGWGIAHEIDQAGIDAAEAAAKAAGQSYYNPLMQTSKTYKLYPGDIKFEDLNGNGYIDRGQNTVDDPGDRKIIGNEEPRYIYSFTLSADWNNIWVSAFFQGVGKQDWYPSNEASTFWGQYNRPYNQMPSWHVDNYWTPENPDAFLPRYTGYYAPFYGGHKNANTRYLMNAAYLRLKNIQVGYNLPSEWIKKLHLTNVGIYLSGENLFTWSPLYKYSKDVNVSNIGESDKDLTSSNSGDGYNYPMMKSFSIGLNVTF